MKLHKTILGAAAALMTIGLLASCQNAASPAKVTNVKAAELECAEGTDVKSEAEAKKIAKSVIADAQGLVGGMGMSFSVVNPEEAKTEVATALFNVIMEASAAADEDPVAKTKKAVEEFKKDLKTNKSASLSVSESGDIEEKDDVYGTIKGSVTVKASAKAADNSTASLTNLTGTYAYTASASASVKANVKAENKTSGAPVTSAVANTVAKAEVKGFSFTYDPLATDSKLTVKGSVAASDSASVGVAFNENGVVGKVLVNTKVGAKVDAKKIQEIAESAVKTMNVSTDKILKAMEDIINVSFDVTVYNSKNESVYTESFDSYEALNKWLK